jgi:hypothetical protein
MSFVDSSLSTTAFLVFDRLEDSTRFYLRGNILRLSHRVSALPSNSRDARPAITVVVRVVSEGQQNQLLVLRQIKFPYSRHDLHTHGRQASKSDGRPVRGLPE